jgi:hypothetical protein
LKVWAPDLIGWYPGAEKISRRMADAGVNIEVLDSDHENQFILVVDDLERGKRVSQAWTQERRGS